MLNESHNTFKELNASKEDNDAFLVLMNIHVFIVRH